MTVVFNNYGTQTTMSVNHFSQVSKVLDTENYFHNIFITVKTKVKSTLQCAMKAHGWDTDIALPFLQP